MNLMEEARKIERTMHEIDRRMDEKERLIAYDAWLVGQRMRLVRQIVNPPLGQAGHT